MGRTWPGYVDQKNYAASVASHDWIFSLDADERISPPLADEIRHVIASEPAERAFRVPRVTFHLGRWVRTTDFYPIRRRGCTTGERRAGRASMSTNPWSRMAPSVS
jgi:glycosyltransferase involved in cell wall biosynthesis